MARCQIVKINFCTSYMRKLILVSYFFYKHFLTVHYSNCVFLVPVQQRTHNLFCQGNPSIITCPLDTRRLVTTPVIKYDVVKHQYPEVNDSFYKIWRFWIFENLSQEYVALVNFQFRAIHPLLQRSVQDQKQPHSPRLSM